MQFWKITAAAASNITNYLFGYQTVSMPPYQPIIADYDFDGRRDIFISARALKGIINPPAFCFRMKTVNLRTRDGPSCPPACRHGQYGGGAMGPDNQWYFIHSYSEMAYRSVPEYQRSLYVHRLNIERRASWRGKPDRFGCREYHAGFRWRRHAQRRRWQRFNLW